MLHRSADEQHLIEIACEARGKWHSAWFTDWSVAAEYAIEEACKRIAVYAGVNPRRCMRSRGAGKGEDVPAVTALPLDFDRRHQHDPERALAFLAAAGIPASEVVESGGGRHVYVVLAEAMPPVQGNALAKRLRLACGGDPVQDLRRVLRVPGSYNVKRGGWCYIVEQYPERVYTGATIAAALDAAGVSACASAPAAKPVEPLNPPADVPALLARLRPSTLEAILKCSGPVINAVAARTDGGGRSWSEVDFRIVLRLIEEADANNEQISAVFKCYAIGDHSRRKSPRYLNRTIESARRGLAKRRSNDTSSKSPEPPQNIAPSPALPESPHPRILVEHRRPPDLIQLPGGRTAINTRARRPRLASVVTPNKGLN
jgi:hypothetical protein